VRQLYLWDAVKEANNARKHGIAFPQAMKVFDDWFSITIADWGHSDGEARLLTIGMCDDLLMVISHVDADDVVRIISAREATPRERRAYMHNDYSNILRDANVDEMEPEYDFSGGERGRYAPAFARALNVAKLDDDVLEYFAGSQMVNDALRVLIAEGRATKRPVIQVTN
jgi:uncharacterized DUF497 family protein